MSPSPRPPAQRSHIWAPPAAICVPANAPNPLCGHWITDEGSTVYHSHGHYHCRYCRCCVQAGNKLSNFLAADDFYGLTVDAHHRGSPFAGLSLKWLDAKLLVLHARPHRETTAGSFALS